jgi:hypothetical protein
MEATIATMPKRNYPVERIAVATTTLFQKLSHFETSDPFLRDSVSGNHANKALQLRKMLPVL